MKEIIATTSGPAAIGPYSQGVKAANMLFLSGQLPIDPVTGELVEGIAAQTERSLLNCIAVLEAAGLSLKNVVKTTVFMKDIDDFVSMNSIYSEFFYESYPARSTVEVARLPRNALVEIEMIAVM